MMGSGQREEDREIKRALTRGDQERAPEFEPMWEAAKAEVAASARERERERERKEREVGQWRPMLAFMVLMGVLGVGFGLSRARDASVTPKRSSPMERARAPTEVKRAAEQRWGEDGELERWESPTDFLLAESEQLERWSLEEPPESWEIWQNEPRKGAADEARDL